MKSFNMETVKSAFAAYQSSPSKFVEKQKSPKTKKSKTKGRDKNARASNVQSNEKHINAKKRARPTNLNKVDEVGPSGLSASQKTNLNGSRINGGQSGKKVYKRNWGEQCGH